MDSPTNKTSALKPQQNRMKIPKVDVDQLLGNVRYIEDNVAALIRRIESGELERGAMVYAMREIRLQLKRLTDVKEAPE